ncbi:MAG: NAD(P)/FAD-dependent oxidoreductase [Deltaproteobacteria bacterium]|nr:NAD(P)/FAD-dependent oxidoreductase [Deltaproteobacteria bacterium]
MIRVGIIGGGPAGIAASISASRCGAKAIIFERTKSVLNKFVLSGGGRCNISNKNISADFYNGGSKNFINNVLKGFRTQDILDFLRDIGSSYFVEEDGRIFTGDSKDTSYKLIKYTISLGTKIYYKSFVEKIEKIGDSFSVRYKGVESSFDKVIVATGGKSFPETGSDGFGYLIAESLGHTIIHPLPGLVSLDLKPNPFAGLQGVTIEASIYLENRSLGIHETMSGKLLFTHRGISGPLARNISGRLIRLSREKGTMVYLNLVPGFTRERLDMEIQTEIRTSGRKKLVNLINRFIPDRLAIRILSESGIPPERVLAELKRDERIRLVENLTNMRINISGSRGFKTAHITTGGVSCDEIRSSTMESKIVKGLYFAGEILDVDGLEGGYNLHWAFATGFIAGKSAASLK